MNDADRGKSLAAALGRIPSGLFVITAHNGSAETGMLASWVQQCSFEPPLISVAVKRGRGLAAWLTPGAVFAVNILDDSQTDMISHFGRGFDLGEPAFEDLEVGRSDGGNVVLEECLAYLECRVESSVASGDHDLYIGRVLGGRMLNDGQSMVHVRKSGLHY